MALDGNQVLSSNEVLRGMEPGSNPLDWIEKNLAKSPIAQAQQAATPVPPPAPKEATNSVTPEAPKDVQVNEFTPEVEDILRDKIQGDATDAAAPKDEKDTKPPEGDSELPPSEAEDTPEASKEHNFKALRQKALEAEKQRKEIEKAKAALEAKLKAYDEGTEIPEVVKTKDARIQELEIYEQMYALKRSPAFKEKFIKPIEEVKSKLNEIAADYEMPKEVLEQALGITNKAELNRFLSENFDAVGALKVSELIDKAQGIQAEAKAAEASPSKALEQIEEEHKRIQAERRAQANEKIIATSKGSWQEAMLALKEEGRAEELIPRENDPEHNEKVVKPLARKAAETYGKLVKALADNGLEHMPKEVAYNLARLVQLATASGVAINSRNIAIQQAEEIQRNVNRTSSYERPPLGGFVGGGRGADKATGPDVSKMTVDEAGAYLVNSVMGRK